MIVPRLTAKDREYNTIHQRNLRRWPKTGVCENCGEKRKTQWSNISGEYRPDDKDDWRELCSPCHKRYDYETFGLPVGIGKRGKAKKGIDN